MWVNNFTRNTLQSRSYKPALMMYAEMDRVCDSNQVFMKTEGMILYTHKKNDS